MATWVKIANLKGPMGPAGDTAAMNRFSAIEAKNVEQDNTLNDLPNRYTPLTRGVLPDGTDLNTLTGAQHVGSWSLLTNYTYPNAPAVTFTSTAVLTVERGGGNSVAHRVTFSSTLLWREVIDSTAGTWSAWAQAETAAAASQKLTDAKAYTDTKDTDNRAAWAAADTNALNTAKAYTDAEVLKDRNRLNTVEGKQAVKFVRLEAGRWIWDPANATHFIIPDYTGRLVVRASARPTPNPTKPALDW